MNTQIIAKAKNYASNLHAERNLTYDGKPYSFHLEMGIDASDKFI